MIHPLRTIRNTIKAVQLTVTNFQRLLFHLISALDRHSEAVATNTAALNQLLLSAKETAAAAQYLAACERHARQESGRRHEFEVPRVN